MIVWLAKDIGWPSSNIKRTITYTIKCLGQYEEDTVIRTPP